MRFYLDSGGAATNSGTTDSNAASVSGTADLTIVSNKTFVDADVNTATDVVTVTGHGYTTGTGVELTTSGTLPAGLGLTTLYFLRSDTANGVTLHPSLADAIADTNRINITAAAGGGTHTINNYTVNLGGAPDLSAVRVNAIRLITTGTSHVFETLGGVHGLTSGDPLTINPASGGAVPTGLLVSNIVIYAEVLSTTTFRVHTTKALAIAGGASTYNLSAAGSRLHMHLTQQDAVAIANSTVSNVKIFGIRAADNTNKLLVLDTVPTISAASDWAIGGRISAGGFADLCNALSPGDTVVQNTDISANPLNATIRSRAIRSSSLAPIQWEGKTGARRLLVNQGSGVLWTIATGSAVAFGYRNVELQAQGTGTAIHHTGATSSVIAGYDSRITDAGSHGIQIAANLVTVQVRCEISGCAGQAISSQFNIMLFYSYFHDTTQASVSSGNNGYPNISIGCIFERSSQEAWLHTQSGGFWFANTFYRAGKDGLARNTTQSQPSSVGNTVNAIIDNIFKDNGNVSSEANLFITQFPTLFDMRADNLFSIDGALGGVQTLGCDLAATDITGDPLFIDPDAAMGSRNFGLQSGSPAKGIVYTFPGGLSASYRDLGAVQRQEPAASTGGGSYTRRR